MENRSHAIAAGSFVLVLLTLLVGLAVWLTRDTGQYLQYEISSQEVVTGLQAQAGVRYKGVTVGRVQSITLDPETAGNVLIRLVVDRAAPISKATFASLGFQGVTGLAFVQLDESAQSPHSPHSTEPLVSDGKHYFPRIPMRQGLVSRLSEQGADLLANLGEAASSINQLAQQAQQAGIPELVKETRQTLAALRTTAERLGQSTQSVTTSADAFKLTNQRMNAPGGTLDQITQSTQVLEVTGQALATTLNETTRTLRQVGSATQMLKENPQALILGNDTLPKGPGEQ